MDNDKKNGLFAKIICVVCVLIIATSMFLSGYFVGSKSNDDESGSGSNTTGSGTDAGLSSIEWMIYAIENYYYFDYDGDYAENAANGGIVAGLDEYSAYYTAEEYAALIADNSGSKSGIGITYNFVSGTGMKIISVVGNSPAYFAGIESGDTIVSAQSSAGTLDFLSCTSSQASAFFSERETDEQFSLTLASGETVALAKEEYEASYVYMRSNETAWDYVTDADGEFVCEQTSCYEMSYLPDDTAYINLSQFYGDKTVDQFGELVSKFNASGYTSLVLDLRNNGGGYVSLMQGISGCFVKNGGTAMVAEYKDGSKTNYSIYKQSSSNVIADGTTVYVLANSGTASASEALIGVLISYGVCSYENIFISDYGEEYSDWYTSGGATLKTAQTYGKGIMQSYYANSSTGEVLKLTSAQIYWQNGKCIHGVGLTADDGCTIVPDVEWTATEGDEELQNVLNIISSR